MEAPAAGRRRRALAARVTARHRPAMEAAAAAIQASMRGKITREEIRARHGKSPRHRGQGHAAAGLRHRDHAVAHSAPPRKSPRDSGSAHSPAHRAPPQAEHGKRHKVKPHAHAAHHSDRATVAIQSAWRGKKGREAAAIESEFGLVLS